MPERARDRPMSPAERREVARVVAANQRKIDAHKRRQRAAGSRPVKPQPAKAKPRAPEPARKQPSSQLAAALSNRLNTATVRPANVKPTPKKELEKTIATIVANAALKQVEPAVRESARRAPSAEVTGAALLGPNLYRKLGGDVEHPMIPEKGSGGWAAFEAAGLLPFGRPLRAIPAGVAATKAAVAGKTAVEAATVAKETYRRSGPVVRALKGARAGRNLERLAEGSYKPRTVGYKGSKTQFPASQSRITRPVQRAADRASEKLARKVDVLRESDSAIKQTVGKALTLPSARRRVPVQAGKHVKREGERARALRADDIRAIRDVGKRLLPGRSLKGEQAANFWYAQLPKSHRNAEGLKLVRGKLAEEHTRLTSGEFAQSVKTAQQGLRAEARTAREAGDTQGVFKAIAEIQKLRAIQADIPERVRDVGENLNKLDRVIAKPVQVNERAIEGLAALERDTREIYVEAGKLKPEVADERKGLVSRWVGLEPTGEEVFIGHRQGKVRGSRPSGMPGGVSIGKTKLPAGIARKNRLVLAKSGRVRQDITVAAEDWQAAQAYKFTSQAKTELAQMGEPVAGRPKSGYVVINPRGHELPRTWKTDDEAQALAEGFDPDEVFAADLEEYVRNTMAGTPAEIESMLQAAEKAGHLADLRQVPKDVVNRYYAQFLPAKIVVATPGIKEGASALSKVGDIANDTLYLSLIYSNVGYIPSQVVANTAMAVAHQGAFFPSNYARATQVLTTGPRRLRDLLHVEHGMGATASAAGTSPIRAISRPVAAVADDSFRLSSVLHEAARLNVIPKGKPVLTKADYRALEEFVTDPRYRAALNDASDRATQAMVDFNRLGAKEAAVAKPAAFVWRWIRGGSRYPIRFAADHPIRTAAGAAAAYAWQDEIGDRFASNQPPWLEGAVKAGTTVVDGKRYPRLLPTRSFSPVSTPLETIGTLAGKPGSRTFGEMLNPGVKAVLNIAQKENPWGGKADSYREAALENLDRLAPTVNFARDLINPPDEPGLYPEDRTAVGRLKRQLRVFPIAVDPKEAAAARARFGKPVPPGQRAYRKVFAERQEFFEATKFAMPEELGKDGKLIPKLQDAFTLKAEVERARELAKAKHGDGDPYVRAAYVEEMKILVRWQVMERKEAARLIAWSRGAPAADISRERDRMRYQVFEDAYLEPIRETRKALIYAGAPLDG